MGGEGGCLLEMEERGVRWRGREVVFMLEKPRWWRPAVWRRDVGLRGRVRGVSRGTYRFACCIRQWVGANHAGRRRRRGNQFQSPKCCPHWPMIARSCRDTLPQLARPLQVQATGVERRRCG